MISSASRGRRLIPVEMYAKDSFAFDALPPVWMSRMQAWQRLDDEVLLEEYDEFAVPEVFEANEDAVEVSGDSHVDNAASTHTELKENTLNSTVRVFCIHNVQSEMQKAATENEQQTCYPDVGVVTEILFDASSPDATNVELILHNLYRPDDKPMTLAPLAVQLDESRSPTPELLDLSDLKLQPTLAVARLVDPVVLMLDHENSLAGDVDSHDQTIPIFFRWQGRSLTPAIQAWSKSPPHATELPETSSTSEHFRDSLVKLSDDSIKKSPVHDDVEEYTEILRRITRQSFLPGIAHLTDITLYTVMESIDDDTDALYRATQAFEQEFNDGECLCLDHGRRNVLPGENFLLVENDDEPGPSIMYPMARSILDTIDQLVLPESLIDIYSETMHDEVGPDSSDLSEIEVVETIIPKTGNRLLSKTTAESTSAEGPVKPNPKTHSLPNSWSFYDSASSYMMTYTALHQIMHASNVGEHLSSTGGDVYDRSNVSDMSEAKTDDSEIIQPREQKFCDTDVQQGVAHTALTQLFVEPEKAQNFPRNYRAYNQVDRLFVQNHASEMREHYRYLSNGQNPVGLRVVNDGGSTSPDTGYARPQVPEMQSPTPALIASQVCYSKSAWRASQARLTLGTPLSPILEEQSLVNASTVSLISTVECSYLTQDCQQVVPITTRRVNFLDEADVSDKSAVAVESVLCTEHLDLSLFFTDVVWYAEPDLRLSFPSQSRFTHINTPEEVFPDSDLLGAFEIEIIGLTGCIYDRLSNHCMQELPALGDDLRWALCNFSSKFPGMGLMAHLGAVMEVLIEHVVSTYTK
ncbi:hypothetical protein ACN47E_005502 [Coniothyrium glycines]